MQIKCGNHKSDTVYHGSVAEVKDCYRASVIAGEQRRSGAEDAFSPRSAEILDRLGSQHARNDATRERGGRASEHMATPKQIDYLTNLIEARQFSDAEIVRAAQEETEAHQHAVKALGRPGIMTKYRASDLITELKAVPVPPRVGSKAVPAAIEGHVSVVTSDGMYRNPGTAEIYKVQYNRASGDGRRLYAKQLVLEDENGIAQTRIQLEGPAHRGLRQTFRYVAGLVHRIDPEWRMTIQQAEQYGALYGNCLRCGRDLTAEESIARAMGPVCSKKANWA